jgi:hypothetical protein
VLATGFKLEDGLEDDGVAELGRLKPKVPVTKGYGEGQENGVAPEDDIPDFLRGLKRR